MTVPICAHGRFGLRQDTCAGRQVRNSYSLRVALLADVFTRVIPLPLPPASPNGADARPGRCIWAATDVRHETQVLLLQSFQLLNTADAEFMT